MRRTSVFGATRPQPVSGPEQVSDDNRQLADLGYEPVLARRMGGFGNFAVSFSVISVLGGCMALYGPGLIAGGPAVMLWGWAVVGFFVLFVGMALAEVTSAYPTSGAMFYMADQLGGRRWGFYTGWLNLLGLIGGIAVIDYGAALFTGAVLDLQWGIAVTPEETMVIFVAILLFHAALNLAGVRLVSVLNSISVWWHLAGVAVILGVLWIAPDSHQSASFVLGEFSNGTGWANPLYVTGIGLAIAQGTLVGYDASAHMSEETSRAAVSAPRGIVRSIWVSWAVGFVLLASMASAIQDYATTAASPVPPAQIFVDAVGTDGATLLLAVVIVVLLCGGNAEVAAGSRMVFAFSRDGALPGSGLWRRLSRSQTPHLAVWLVVAAACLITLPSLYSPTAFTAVSAINIIGMTPAYAIPIFLRLRHGNRFRKGPWHLGRWSKPVGWIAVVWVVFVTVLFCLPQRNPVTVETFNYAPVALVAVLLLAELRWPFARRAYNPPTPTPAAQDRAHVEEFI
ncbi:amino acid permease [Streptomyces sp. NBC_01317]|uniref:amino acid permease n=1 Tax=Streptomyces sp. NBC_01317 TaxID=2903822 RepID=UPI002E0E600E|nr:amino acid permease [Streptomyces sp. NBC_01317]